MPEICMYLPYWCAFTFPAIALSLCWSDYCSGSKIYDLTIIGQFIFASPCRIYCIINSKDTECTGTRHSQFCSFLQSEESLLEFWSYRPGHKRKYLIWKLWKTIALYLTWIQPYFHMVLFLHHMVLISLHNT